jgi:hypothetical protein
MQVAETFSAEFSEQMIEEDVAAALEAEGTSPESKVKLAKILADGGLSKISRLDTCVTVVDCTTVSTGLNVDNPIDTFFDEFPFFLQFIGDFDTTDFLSDRHGDVGEDERNITDL